MSIFSDLLIRIKGDNSSLDSSLKDSQDSISKFKGAALAMGAAISAAVVAAFALWKKAMESTEATMDTLEAATSYFKGGFQGLMETIATGDWGGLIDNITKTAKAYRDLTIAQDENLDTQAANSVMKARLEAQLQSARVASQTADSPALKAQYLQEAIDAQKAITNINKSEIDKQLKDTEAFFATKLNMEGKAADNMAEFFRRIAMNHEYYFGEMGGFEALKIRERELLYKQSLGALSSAEITELSKVSNAVKGLNMFAGLRETLEPDKMNEYVKGVGNLFAEFAAGEQAIYRLVGQLGKLEDKLGNIQKESISKTSTSNISMPSLGISAGSTLAGSPITSLTQGLTESQQALLDLSKTFSGFFSDVNMGFQGMIDGVITGIKRLIMELLAQAIILTLLTLVTGGTVNGAMFKSLIPAGVGKAFGGAASGGATGAIGSGLMQNQLVASLSGKDIKIVLRRDV